MTKYQWFKNNCLNRNLVKYILYKLANKSYLKRNRFINTLHKYKISLNRITFIHNDENHIFVDYYTRRKNKYGFVIWK